MFYRRAYAFDPEQGAVAFEAIDRRCCAKRAARRTAKSRSTARRSTIGTSRRTAERRLHAIARIEETELKDDAAAIDTYRAALDMDEERPALARSHRAPQSAHGAQE